MVFMLTKLIDMAWSKGQVNIMYDICCQLEKHLKVKMPVKIIPYWF